MNFGLEEFSDILVAEHKQGKIKSMSEMWQRCYQNPKVYGRVVEKLQRSRDVPAPEVSSGSNAAPTAGADKTDSGDTKEVSGVRTRSRAAKGELKADSEVKPRRKVSKTVRFPSDGVIKGEEVVLRHRRGWYSEKGESCLRFLWEQTQRVFTSVGVCALRVGLNWWQSLQRR